MHPGSLGLTGRKSIRGTEAVCTCLLRQVSISRKGKGSFLATGTRGKNPQFSFLHFPKKEILHGSLLWEGEEPGDYKKKEDLLGLADVPYLFNQFVSLRDVKLSFVLCLGLDLHSPGDTRAMTISRTRQTAFRCKEPHVPTCGNKPRARCSNLGSSEKGILRNKEALRSQERTDYVKQKKVTG